MKSNKLRIFGNIIYYLNIWLHTYPLGLVFIFLSVPFGILAIYEGITIPKMILSGIEAQTKINSVIQSVGISFFILLLSKIIMEILETKIKTRGTRPMMWLYSEPIHKKLFTISYQKLISSEVQNKVSKVENIIFRAGDGGPIHFFGMTLSLLLTSITGSIVFTSNIIKIDKLLLIVIFLSAIINLLYEIYAGNYSNKNMKERSEYEKKELYFTKVMENKTYSKDIRFYELLPGLKNMFYHYHKIHASFLKKEANINFLAVFINAFCLLIRDVIAYLYLIHQLSTGYIRISEFVFLIMLIMQFSSWMDNIVQNINLLILFSAQMEQIRDFLETEDRLSQTYEDKNHSLKAKDISMPPKIEIKNLSYHYPESKTNIFEEFNLTINPGEKLALVGINGAGKTTLMLLLMGLLEANSGEIKINGHSMEEFSKEEYYKLFSPVFQDISIFPESIALNITGGNSYKEEDLLENMKQAGMINFINQLKEKQDTMLVRESSENAVDLSGGMNQRLLLARGLYKNAPINILDEPTAALDPIAESKIYEEYNTMSKNKTSIFISHRLASTRFCDRIIFLENGKILESGSHEELMKLNANYRFMYETQSKYYQEGEAY